MRYQHHHDFLQTCRENNVIPEGLQVRKTASIGIYSTAFGEKWSQILNSASREIRDLISEEFSFAVDTVKRDIMEQEARIANGFGVSVLDKFNDKAREICGKLEHSLAGRRRSKFNKLDSSLIDNIYTTEAASFDTDEHPPTGSQVGSFITTIRREVDRAQYNMALHVTVEDLGVEENPSGINPLPVDSSLILVDLSEEYNNEEMTKHLPRVIASNETQTIDDTVKRNTEEISSYANSLSVDDLALLLVDLAEGRDSGETNEHLPSHSFPSRTLTPTVGTEGNITEEQRVEIETPIMNILVWEHAVIGFFLMVFK